MDNLIACRTAALGGHIFKCPECRFEKPVYNPCLDRHCPKCHRQKQADWVEQRSKDLLPIPYFHVVFTVPPELHALFLANRKVAYELLFKAAGETLLEVAARRLGAKIGILSILHTWTQTLLYHPHIHCIVTGGGLSLDGERWVSCRPNFFLAVRVLGEVYRGKLLRKLQQAMEGGRLRFDHDQAQRCLRRSARKRWVVFSKPPFAGPEVFLKYISRYVHRVAIDDRRLVGYDGQRVTFSYRDRRSSDIIREMTLTASAFLRRFLLHLLPKGFTKIRSYGFLANGIKAKNLRRCRELLGPVSPVVEDAPTTGADDQDDDEEEPRGHACPHCDIWLERKRLLLPATLTSSTPSVRPP